jgi:hypothetical protein
MRATRSSRPATRAAVVRGVPQLTRAEVQAQQTALQRRLLLLLLLLLLVHRVGRSGAARCCQRCALVALLQCVHGHTRSGRRKVEHRPACLRARGLHQPGCVCAACGSWRRSVAVTRHDQHRDAPWLPAAARTRGSCWPTGVPQRRRLLAQRVREQPVSRCASELRR